MIANIDRELAQLEVASSNLMLAAPKGYPLTKSKKLRLRDLNNASFIWFPRRESPVYYHWLERPICSYRLDPQFGPLRFYFCESRNASKSRSSAGVWIIPSGMGERSWISRFAMSLFLTAR